MSLERDDDIAAARRKHAGANSPPIFVSSCCADVNGRETAEVELDMPPLMTRLAMNAQDPISSVHYYQVCQRILLPAAFGYRMCLNCPHCNVDEHDPSVVHGAMRTSCQDLNGKNCKPIGGYAGLAEAAAFAVELQGEGTLHGHGFVALANIYQHSTLQDVAELIESNFQNLTPEDIVKRITSFCEHVHREDHMDNEWHQQNLEMLEKEFHCNNDGPMRDAFLTARSRSFYDVSRAPSLWQKNHSSSPEVQELREQVYKEAEEFRKKFDMDVQIVFSRTQHHWHQKNKDGERIPMKYCKPRGKFNKKKCCKRGFPKHVFRNKKTGAVDEEKARVCIVCKGVALKMNLKVSGRRNMLGSIAGKRRCEYFSGTSALLALLFRSNTNAQVTCVIIRAVDREGHHVEILV